MVSEYYLEKYATNVGCTQENIITIVNPYAENISRIQSSFKNTVKNVTYYRHSQALARFYLSPLFSNLKVEPPKRR
jgi:hypothetical protein